MRENKQIRIIICIVFITGLIGGLGNMVFNLEEDATFKSISSLTIFKSLILGVIGAGIVPLIPGMLMNNIIDTEETRPGVLYTRMLRFGSFCLVASLFSSILLTDTLEVVRGNFKDVKDVKKEIAQQREKIDEANQRSKEAEKKSKDANAKSDAALKVEQISVKLIANGDSGKRLDEKRLSSMTQNDDLSKEEKRLFIETQKSVFLSKEKIFNGKSIPDSLNIQKALIGLQKKGLIYKTIIDSTDVYVSNAKWFGD